MTGHQPALPVIVGLSLFITILNSGNCAQVIRLPPSREQQQVNLGIMPRQQPPDDPTEAFRLRLRLFDNKLAKLYSTVPGLKSSQDPQWISLLHLRDFLASLLGLPLLEDIVSAPKPITIEQARWGYDEESGVFPARDPSTFEYELFSLAEDMGHPEAWRGKRGGTPLSFARL